jgi:chromosome segregation ATPase
MVNKEKKPLIDVSEQEIKLTFHNYKLLKKEEFDLKGSHIYFIKGPNEVGKSSILFALRAAMEIKDDTNQKVTVGETEGVNEFTIPGPDGKMYNIVYEFTDTTTKFVIFDEDGNKISKITEMRNIFKYNHVDATSFIAWSNSAEGRRKQKEYILELLPSDSYIKYKDLENEEKVLFDQRTNANKELEANSRLQKEYELTGEEKSIQEHLEPAKIQLKQREEELATLTHLDDEITKITGQMIQIAAKIDSAKRNHQSYIEQVATINTHHNSNILTYENQIKELEVKIKSEKEAIQKSLKDIEVREKELSTLTAPDEKELLSLTDKKKSLDATNKTDQEKVEKLTISVENGRNYVNKAKVLSDKLAKFDGFKAKSDTLVNETATLTEKITSIRKSKEDIIVKGEFPVENLSFDEEGYLTINGLRFDEHQTCESDTILIVAQLLCKMNITPIQILGDASLLDYNKLDKLYDIAEANGKIMFVDEIDRTLDKLVIVGYEKKSKDKLINKNKSTNPLF